MCSSNAFKFRCRWFGYCSWTLPAAQISSSSSAGWRFGRGPAHFRATNIQMIQAISAYATDKTQVPNFLPWRQDVCLPRHKRFSTSTPAGHPGLPFAEEPGERLACRGDCAGRSVSSLLVSSSLLLLVVVVVVIVVAVVVVEVVVVVVVLLLLLLSLLLSLSLSSLLLSLLLG